MWQRRKRNKDRFSAWIRDHHRTLYQHALWMTGSADLAADAVQDTYHQAWLAMDSLRDGDKALPWLADHIAAGRVPGAAKPLPPSGDPLSSCASGTAAMARMRVGKRWWRYITHWKALLHLFLGARESS